MGFEDAVVNGIPLIVIIMGLVEFAKKFGLQGNGCVVLSLILGIVFGIAYQLQSGVLPVDFAGWFAVAVYGLGMGLVTSGMWDVVQGRLY